MKLTKKRAKAISLEVWRYLRDHPEIETKENLPPEIYKKIEKVFCKCPLCEILYCNKCPLFIDNNSCGDMRHPYHIWMDTAPRLKKTRAKHAAAIVELIEAWEV